MKIWVLNPPFLDKFSRSQRSPAVTKSGTLYYPTWLASIVGVLEQDGHEVVFTDAPARGLDAKACLALASKATPRLVVVEMSTPSVESDLAFCQALKSTLQDIFIVAVGTHVSALPTETLASGPALDAAARREADYTLRDLAATLANASSGERPDTSGLKNIPGLSYRREDGDIVHNPERPYIEDLDALPWLSKVYRKHLRIDDYFNPNAPPPMVTLLTSRGCPFHCTFCTYPQTFTGRKYRFRSIQDIVDEMQFVEQQMPEARSIFFEDDTLTANKKRCRELAEAVIARGLRIPWVANSRIEVDLETLRLLKRAGCRHLCVGFESGDPRSLEYMHKGTNIPRMFQFMKDARAAGVRVHGCFMVGFPGEDQTALDRTLKLALDLNPDTAQFYPVMVYPGTEAYDDYRRRGWIAASSYRDWLTPEGLHNCVIHNEHFTASELVHWCDTARKRFYLRPHYILRKLGQAATDSHERARTWRAAKVFARHLFRGSDISR